MTRAAVGAAAVLAALALAACGSSAPSSPDAAAPNPGGSSAGGAASGDGAATGDGAAVPASPSSPAPSPASGGLAAPAPSSVSPPQPGADGLPPVVDRIDVEGKIVFLTIDDGWTKSPELLALLREYSVPVTAFATEAAIRDDTAYFRRLAADGSSIQNHSMTHVALKNAGYATNEREICRASDLYEREFGTRPWLLRPPFGSWSRTTQEAAKSCGIRYLVMWSVSQPGRYLRFAEGSHLRPGDIILLHFEAKTPEYLARTLRTLEAGGWKVGRLEDYLPAP